VNDDGSADPMAIEENNTLNSCFREKLDWRKCKDEVSDARLSYCQQERPNLESLTSMKGDRYELTVWRFADDGLQGVLEETRQR
jgi:hypothetical protein